MRSHHVASMALAALFAAGGAQAQDTMRFRAMDTNRDGAISRTEWRGTEQSFRVHDWDGNDMLSGDEVRVGGQRRRSTDVDDYDAAPNREFNDWTAEAFNSHDHDRDGRLDRSEWHYDLESFRRADRDRDGLLTRVEFLSADADIDREDRFEYLDANRNGAIEPAEWHGSRDAFDWLDRNNDDRLTRSEVVGDAAEASDLFANLDSDRNNRIAMDEWHWSRRSFNQRDANRDGVLSRSELSGADIGGRPIGTSGLRDSRIVIVEANQRWVDSGIDVQLGDSITVSAEGSVQLSANGNDRATPGGSVTGRRADAAPIRGESAGALIARIGSSAPIFIGENDSIASVPASGRLYLSVNDDHLADNSGQFRVIVSK
jgi:Ca2+-binding EF-hand superfamily protein